MFSWEKTMEELTCSFCHRKKTQVGKLPCGHLMCAICFPYFSRQLEKCYLCVLATADVKRSAMELLSTNGEPCDPKEKLFCPNAKCSFIGCLQEMKNHLEICDFSWNSSEASSEPNKSNSLPEETRDLVGDSTVSVAEGSSPACRSKDKIVKRHKILSSTKISPRCTQALHWRTTQPADADAGTKSLPACPESSPIDETCVEKSKRIKSLSCVETGPLVDLVENNIPSDAAPVLSCETPKENGETMPGSSVLRRKSESKENSTSSRASSVCRNSWWDPCFAFLLTIIVVLWHVDTDKHSVLPTTLVNHGGRHGTHYVTGKLTNVANLFIRAQFNKRDMQLTDFGQVGNYRVKLGVGATLSTTENVVILWVTAVMLKNDELPWPADETMQVRLEHADPDLAQVYDFKFGQKGNWRESSRVHRGKLVYRQMQVETTSHLKYMRFSYLLTYEEGVAKQFIVDDSLTVGFKLTKV